jgi:serine/threonine protein kinase
MANRVGQQLGNYHLSRLLGRGGFAEVYLGEPPADALKRRHHQVPDEEVTYA